MNRLLRFALMAGLAVSTAACGNKGPLVMPQKPVPVEDSSAADGPAPASETAATTEKEAAATIEETGGDPVDEPMNENE